jgi:hypothetical protein
MWNSSGVAIISKCFASPLKTDSIKELLVRISVQSVVPAFQGICCPMALAATNPRMFNRLILEPLLYEIFIQFQSLHFRLLRYGFYFLQPSFITSFGGMCAEAARMRLGFESLPCFLCGPVNTSTWTLLYIHWLKWKLQGVRKVWNQWEWAWNLAVTPVRISSPTEWWPTRGLSTTDPASLNFFTSFPTALCYWIPLRTSGIKLIFHLPLGPPLTTTKKHYLHPFVQC